MKSCCNLISVYLKNKKRRVLLYLSVSSSAVEYCFRYSCLYNAHSVSSSGTRAKEESITAARYMLEINIFMSSVGGKYTLSIYKISIYLWYNICVLSHVKYLWQTWQMLVVYLVMSIHQHVLNIVIQLWIMRFFVIKGLLLSCS